MICVSLGLCGMCVFSEGLLPNLWVQGPWGLLEGLIGICKEIH